MRNSKKNPILAVFALFILISFSISSVNARSAEINSTNSLFQNILTINNGTNFLYLLNISRESTSSESTSKVSAALQTGNLTGIPIALANKNVTFETISLRQKKDIRLEMSGLGNTYTSAPTSAENNFDFLVGKSFSAYLMLRNDSAVNTAMSKGGGLANSGYILRIDNNRRVTVKSDGVTILITGSNAFSNDIQQYVTWTFNETHATAYVNGTFEGAALHNETGANSLKFEVGVQSNSRATSPLNGSVRMVSVVNQTLSPQQAQSLYWNEGVPTKSANLTEIGQGGSVTVKPNGDLIIIDGNNTYTSTDKGATVVLNYSFGPERNGTVGIFIDNLNNTYINWENINALFRYPNSDFTNEQRVLNISCDNSTTVRIIMPDTFTQARNNNIFVGTYDASASGVAYSEQCGHIHMSSDSGLTWTLAYNDTASEPTDFRIARHVHSVQCDPHSTNCYASMGDGPDRRKLLRFSQDGTGFTILHRGNEQGITWQPTTLAFTKNYVFAGEDFNVLNEYSRIARSRDNGTNWEVVFNEDKKFQGFIWGQVMVDNQTVCMNYRDQDGTTDGVAVCSDDDFNTTFNYYRVEAGAAAGTNTARRPSNVGPNGEFYSLLSGYTNYTRVEINPKPQVIALYPMHENSGNTSNDISGNRFHADINGSVWNYSTGYNYLNKYTDFKVNSTIGNITLINNQFNFSEIEADYDYFTGESIYNNLKLYYNFDADNSTTSFDLSGNSNNSEFQGSAVVNRTDGMFGTPGMTTNGLTANYLRAPASQSLNFTHENITMSMWVKPHPGVAMGGLFSTTIGGTGPRTTVGTQTYESQLSIRMQSANGEAKTAFVTDTFFNHDVWRHIALVLKNNGTGTELKVFIDGNIQANTHYNVSGDMYNNTDASIGKVHSFASVNGTMDEFMLFDIELLDGQIEAIYTNQSERFYKTGRIQINGSLPITAGNNKLNTSFSSVQTNPLANISSVIHYFNSNWFDTIFQLIESNTNYLYSITLDSTAIGYNLSLAGKSGFYTPLVGDNFTYNEIFEASGGTGTGGCTTSWTCAEWGACISNEQTRSCRKLNERCPAGPKPAETQACILPPSETGAGKEPVCGNGICEEDKGETYDSCPQECIEEELETDARASEKEAEELIPGIENSVIVITTGVIAILSIIILLFLLLKKKRKRK